MAGPENEQDFDVVTDYEAQAREFLAKGRQYLVAGDLHQASEQGMGCGGAHGQGRGGGSRLAVRSAPRFQPGDE